MSRIGKNPVSLPKGVKVNMDNSLVHVEGPKGKLSVRIPPGIKVETKEDKVFVNRLSDSRQDRANHGTIRILLQNMMVGVTQGHKKNLEIQGVGFRVQIQGKNLILSMGFSHPVEFPIPEGVSLKEKTQTEIEVEGIDKALVGDVAARIRKIKPAEPYKGKGIRYAGEFVRRKQGKTVTK